jgi:DNA processing protein
MDDYELLACLSVLIPKIAVHDFTLGGVGSALWGRSEELLARASRIRERCHAAGVRILHPAHPDYPHEFWALENPPLFLSMFGQPAWLDRPCLSVVGSRDPSVQAIEWLELHLPRFMNYRPVAIVSGGARGIDQKAHALSLGSKQPTVAFLPSGIEAVYPHEFRHWIAEILDGGGAVLSEFAPDEPMRKGHFERRNRMIAALGVLTLVAEARRRSGSVMTARLARDLGRTVAAPPASPLDGRAAGTLDILFDGGQMVREAEDIVTLFDRDYLSVRRGYLCAMVRQSAPGSSEAPHRRD